MTSMNSARPVELSEALVPVSVVVDSAAADAAPLLCGTCGGPPQLCGGMSGECMGGADSPRVLRWLTAFRAVYAGLVLITTPGALWGGALLRLGRQLAVGKLPRGFADAVDVRAYPSGVISGRAAAKLALPYLRGRDADHEALSTLFRWLLAGSAPWLVDVRKLGARAAICSPLDATHWDLLAVLCDSCADIAVSDGLPVHLEHRIVSVGSYDAAIRCPACGVVPAHPLGEVTTGEPHPVGRCLPDPRKSSGGRCWSHRGGELDSEGLCSEGRGIFDQAALEMKAFGATTNPYQRNIVESFLRARWWATARRVDGNAIARSMVLSPEFSPFFKALAAANPEAAETLAKIVGAPLDTDGADLGVQAAVQSGGGLQGVIAAGESAVAQFFSSVFGGTTAAPRVLRPGELRAKAAIQRRPRGRGRDR